jgi:hypothetical protein
MRTCTSGVNRETLKVFFRYITFTHVMFLPPPPPTPDVLITLSVHVLKCAQFLNHIIELFPVITCFGLQMSTLVCIVDRVFSLMCIVKALPLC